MMIKNKEERNALLMIKKTIVDKVGSKITISHCN